MSKEQVILKHISKITADIAKKIVETKTISQNSQDFSKIIYQLGYIEGLSSAMVDDDEA